MLNEVRQLVLMVLTQGCYIYAICGVLRRGYDGRTVEAGKEPSSRGVRAGASPSAGAFRLDTAALKLCIMLTAAGGAMALGADAFPLFPEMRVIAMYLLIFAPATTQQEVYDKAFSPLLVKMGSLARSLQSSDFLTKRVCLFAIRRLVSVCIALMNYVERCHTLEPDAIKDILGGLVFTRRALDDVEAQQRLEQESGSPLFGLSFLSSFSKSGGPEALQDFAASLVTDGAGSSLGGGASLTSPKPEAISFDFSRPTPGSVFSSSEEGGYFGKAKKRN